MTLSAKQQRIVELALDNLDVLGEADRAKVEYAVEQLVEGGLEQYFGPERPDRSDSDKTMFCEIITHTLHARGVDLLEA
jgi:hypothetical protein